MSAGIVGSCLTALVGCATPDAADPRGKWRPLHQFAEAPQAIPLQQAYVFQAFPSDQTLKRLLTRWSNDAGLGLSYLHTNDYTLHAPVALLRTTSIEQATSALSSAYAAQGLHVSAERGAIVVSHAQAASAAPAAGVTD
ncbi:MAG: hypothetical protein ACJ8GV_14665 [Luteimonas sp.]